MNERPPIPPNCEFFSRLRPQFTLVVYQGQCCTLDIDLTQPMDCSIRLIIAAVARCAWLDMAERMNSTYDPEHGPNLTSIDTAVKNADAWRVWGEQK